MTSYQKPEVWKNYELVNYKGFPTKQKDLSAFERFKKYVLSEKFANVLSSFATKNNCNIPNKYKIRIISKASAELWNKLVLEIVAADENMRFGTPAFDKFKKSASGRRIINDKDSELLNHLNLVNETIHSNVL